MRISALKKEVIANFSKLNEMAKINRVDPEVFPIWGIRYKKNNLEGFISEFGTVETKNTRLKIFDDDVLAIKLPLFRSMRKALRNANKLLKNAIADIANPNVVKKESNYFSCNKFDDITQIDILQTKHGINW